MSVSVLWRSRRRGAGGGTDDAGTPAEQLRRARRDGTESDAARLPPDPTARPSVITGLPPELELTRRREDRRAGRGEAPPDAERGTPVLVLPDGTRLPLHRTTVVGRAPRPQHDAVPLVLADPTRSVSRDHALLEPTASGLTVTDLDSGNGTTLTSPDGRVAQLVPGHAQEARPGSVLTLGDLVVVVESSAATPPAPAAPGSRRAAVRASRSARP